MNAANINIRQLAADRQYVNGLVDLIVERCGAIDESELGDAFINVRLREVDEDGHAVYALYTRHDWNWALVCDSNDYVPQLVGHALSALYELKKSLQLSYQRYQ